MDPRRAAHGQRRLAATLGVRVLAERRAAARRPRTCAATQRPQTAHLPVPSLPRRAARPAARSLGQRAWRAACRAAPDGASLPSARCRASTADLRFSPPTASLALRLQRAAHHLASEFSVRVRGELTEAQRRGILGGVLDRGTALDVEAARPPAARAPIAGTRSSRAAAAARTCASSSSARRALVSRVLRTRFGPLDARARVSRAGSFAS